MLRNSGLNPQSCLYFQGFQGSKLLNGCLVLGPRDPFLRFLGFKIYIYEFRCIFRLTAILRLFEGKTLFFFNMQFLLLLSKRGLNPLVARLVAYKLVAY